MPSARRRTYRACRRRPTSVKNRRKAPTTVHRASGRRDRAADEPIGGEQHARIDEAEAFEVKQSILGEQPIERARGRDWQKGRRDVATRKRWPPRKCVGRVKEVELPVGRIDRRPFEPNWLEHTNEVAIVRETDDGRHEDLPDERDGHRAEEDRFGERRSVAGVHRARRRNVASATPAKMSAALGRSRLLSVSPSSHTASTPVSSG